MRSTITDWGQIPLMVPIPLAAETVGVSRSTLRNLIERGELRAKRVGGRVFVTKSELERFIGDEVAS